MLLKPHLISNGGVKSKDQQTKTEEVLSQIGSSIRALRKEKGWTQEKLAEMSGINDKEVSHIEQGRRNITIDTLVKISKALEVNIESIISK